MPPPLPNTAYDILMRELRFDARVRPTNKLQDEEQLARIEKVCRRRRRRRCCCPSIRSAKGSIGFWFFSFVGSRRNVFFCFG